MRTQILKQCDSTNDQLKRLSCQKDFRPPLAVIAREQSAGRGRWGRRWASPSGGVYFSLVVEAPAPVERLSALPLVVALAVHETLTAFSPRVALKWPNDLLALDDAGVAAGKLAGILVETLEQMAAPRLAIIGVGVNIQRPLSFADEPPTATPAYLGDLVAAPTAVAGPAAEGSPATAAGSTAAAGSATAAGPAVAGPAAGGSPATAAGSTAAAGSATAAGSTAATAPDPIALAQLALAAIEDYLGRWARGDYHFAPLVSRYLQHLALLDKNIPMCNTSGKEVGRGTVSGVDENGALLLATADGQTQAFSCGEITLNPGY
ncbi:MAG: biotin--[acetyl-CoA-carboxylase] ligase [Coriobacteriales bacterium]|nr:biotin--[acetyl-CoA-carboxylase] ligase [Coriobacteriales bacterium]